MKCLNKEKFIQMALNEFVIVIKMRIFGQLSIFLTHRMVDLFQCFY